MKKFFRKLEHIMEIGGIKKDLVLLAVSAVCVILSLFGLTPKAFDIAWIAVVLCGLPIVLGAVAGLITEFDIRADVLVSIALIASICIGEIFAAGEVAVIMQIGSLLEELTVSRARAGIEKLIDLTPQTARVITDGNEHIVKAEEVLAGDLVRVLPGETIPADGIIISGTTSINEAVMTGESMPVDKTEGDEVSSGTVNLYGAFDMKALKAAADSSLARMIRLVESADAGKAKIVGIADRWATWIVIIALLAAALTWIFSGEIIRAVTILVVFCPCALVLATPTAITAAIGNCTRHGFLVKEGDALERLSKVKIIAFDKTGTLTYGKPEVIAVKSLNVRYTEEELFAYAAAAENFSEHPLGKAVVNSYFEKTGKRQEDAAVFKMLPGMGVMAKVHKKKVLAGNSRLLEENNITYKEDERISEYSGKGATIIHLAIDNEYAGFMALSDTIRENSKDTISALKRLQLTPVLLTGDNAQSAASVSAALGIDEVKSSCLPADKLKYIDEYESKGLGVCMIGDGINDAPALKKASASIAMGGAGSDIAADSADIALINDEIKELPHIIALSGRMMVTIKLNMAFSLTLNFAAIVLAIIGTLSPVVGALVHNAGSVLVIINSALLLGWKKRKR